ncbi:MAG: response regulator transcription factor [Bacteroidota bacterium]
MIRILLFEDKHQYVESVRMYFEESDKVFLAASFPDASRAVKEIRKYQPDVVLMDIEMPGISGIEALQKIKEAEPNTRILMQTAFEDNHKIFVSLCAGASGYILKSSGLQALEDSIIDVHNGGGYFSPSIATKVIKLMKPEEQTPEYVKLTQSEHEILECLVEGMSYKMIEAKLGKSYHVIHFHIKNIYKKLHVHSKSEAVIKALKNHII